MYHDIIYYLQKLLGRLNVSVTNVSWYYLLSPEVTWAIEYISDKCIMILFTSSQSYRSDWKKWSPSIGYILTEPIHLSDPSQRNDVNSK